MMDRARRSHGIAKRMRKIILQRCWYEKGSNLPRRRAGSMAALDTFYDNLCHWRCIAMHKGVRPDRSTQAHKKPRTAPNNIAKTSLDR